MISGQRHSEILEGLKLCRACGAECVFECQLMPALVYILQTHLCCPPHHNQLTGSTDAPPSPSHGPPKAVEFGTVIIFTCSASCWEENCTSQQSICNFRREMVFVQSESTDSLNQ